MADRCGQNGIILMGIESAYGTQQKTPTVKFGGQLSYNDIKSEVSIPVKTGQITSQSIETTYGNTYVEATLTGALTANVLGILAEALTGDDASPFVHGNTCTRDGLTLYRYYDLGTAGTTTDDKYDAVIGAILTDFSITPDTAGIVQFTATFRGQSLKRDTLNATTDALTLTSLPDSDTSFPEDAVARWADITGTLGGAAAITNFTALSLSLTNELCSDEQMFLNSDTIQNPYIMRSGGSLTASWIFDDSDDPDVYNNIQGTLQEDSFSLFFGGALGDEWTFATYGKVESYENPDVDRCKVIASMTKKLMGDSTYTMLTITDDA